MRSRPAIQKLITAGLLFLSLISFLPKAFFHEVLAAHKDGVTCTHPDKSSPCVHSQGYNCSFTDLVVSAPYEPAINGFRLPKPQRHSSFNSLPYSFFLPVAFFSAESRGPPVFES